MVTRDGTIGMSVSARATPGKQGHLRRLGRLEPGPQHEGEIDPLAGGRKPVAPLAAPPSCLGLGDDERPLDGPRDGQISGQTVCRIHFLLENDPVPQALRPQGGPDLGGKEPVEGLLEHVALPRRGVDDVAFVSQAAGLLPDRRPRRCRASRLNSSPDTHAPLRLLQAAQADVVLCFVAITIICPRPGGRYEIPSSASIVNPVHQSG